MAVADFTNPKLTQDYTTLLQSIRDLNSSQALMHDSTGIVNVPTGTIRWSAANNRFEKYDGTSFNALTVSYSFSAGIFTSAGTPVVINSTDSTGPKIAFQDTGAVKGYYGASTSLSGYFRNSGNTITTFSVDQSGNGTFAGGVTATTGSFAGGGVPFAINSTTSYGVQLQFLGGGTSNGYIGANTVQSLRVLNGAQTLATLNVDQFGNGTFTGNVNATSGYFTNSISMVRDGVAGDPYGPIAVTRGTASNFAYFGMTRSGQIGWSMGIDTSNRYIWGTGASGGGVITNVTLILDTSGNLIAGGNVTAYSDERLKEDWQPVQDDFVALFAAVKSGTYSRKDNGLRQVGVSAQSLRAVMPEAVLADSNEDQTLSVAYGNAALVAAIELAKKVVELEARLKLLEAK